MKHIKIWLAAIAFLICAPAFADSPATDSAKNDPFNEVVANYLAANPKPSLPEEARKFKVQAEFAVQEKQFDRAVELYGKALEIAPWWPQGHFNRAIILGELKKYRKAMLEMKRYLQLAPDASDARAAQDKVYQWESAAGQVPEEFRDCPDCPAMVEIPSKGFAIGKYEVTFDEWDACVAAGGCNGYKPVDGRKGGVFSSDTHWGRGKRPVINVSWDDAQTYIQWLSKKTGKTYRLPKEAEWEYACYGGSQTEYCGGNDVNAVAWHNGNSGNQTHPVGQKQANGYGLYDMSGNVWEWMEDCWEGNCAKRVLRGGSWDSDPQIVRAAYRCWFDTTYRISDCGFRLARTLP